MAMIVVSEKDAMQAYELVSRHVVGIALDFSKGKEEETWVLSAFLMSANDEWFIATAGHNLDNVVDKRGQGFTISRCDLFDSLSTTRRDQSAIPFDWAGADPFSFWKLEGYNYDYGILRLTRNLRELLEANGKMAIEEFAWGNIDDIEKPNCFVLAGIPAETVASRGSSYAVQISSVREVERDDPFEPQSIPMFYGQIIPTEGYSSIVGMSGGPIFACRADEQRFAYRLHALQSGWNKSDRRIAGPLTEPLGSLVVDMMERRGIKSLLNARKAREDYWEPGKYWRSRK